MVKRVRELCELMELPNDESFLRKKPREISGGQQQRVGIARALFMKPKIMLMDEPFSALDPITRAELQKEFIDTQKKLGLTIVLVTHDLSEAFTMADEIVLLRDGAIEQKGRPSKFLLSPASNYVENFVLSHSPGSRLKEVYLYSVVNTNLWLAKKIENEILLTNIENCIEVTHKNREQAKNFLWERSQSSFYWVDSNNQFLNSETLEGEVYQGQLFSTDNILTGMKSLLQHQNSVLPVVNEDNNVIGVFSEEALDAL